MILIKFRRKKIDFFNTPVFRWVLIPTFFLNRTNNVTHYGVYHDWISFDSRHRHTRSPGRPCGRRTTPNISGGVLHLELSQPSLLCSFKNDLTSFLCDVENRNQCF